VVVSLVRELFLERHFSIKLHLIYPNQNQFHKIKKADPAIASIYKTFGFYTTGKSCIFFSAKSTRPESKESTIRATSEKCKLLTVEQIREGLH
jgi:hypothetical protein